MSSNTDTQVVEPAILPETVTKTFRNGIQSVTLVEQSATSHHKASSKKASRTAIISLETQLQKLLTSSSAIGAIDYRSEIAFDKHSAHLQLVTLFYNKARGVKVTNFKTCNAIATVRKATLTMPASSLSDMALRGCIKNSSRLSTFQALMSFVTNPDSRYRGLW